MDDKVITISMEEYKELLMIKGKYEELKSQQLMKITTPDYHIKDLTQKYRGRESIR